MEDHTSDIPSRCNANKPILLKHPKKPTSKSFILFKPRNIGNLLLLLAICTSLSLFWLGFSLLQTCGSEHQHRLQIDGNFDDEGLFFESTATNVSYNDEFWKQPDGLGFRPCLNYSDSYERALGSRSGNRERRRFLMVVVSGGLNQQKNQIADSVVIARILKAALVLPILQVDQVWGDQSEFSDIFDDRHFKEALKDDVHVVSTLPVDYLRRRPVSVSITPTHIDEEWVRTKLMPSIKKNDILIIRGFNSRLTKNLNPDLQKLRCKVAFKALKFRNWIEELGEKLAERMAQGGPYMALHLRLEKDVWVRTGCLPGLGEEADHMIKSERASHPELLKGRTKIAAWDRYVAGLCPLNAIEITRLIKALGASNDTRIYWAGGMPFGGEKALKPLQSHFPHLYNKWDLSQEGELDHIKHKSSILAAVDYLVCLKSQVFMANHGGNMATSMQGHRAFLGHMKHITPNKKQLVKLFMNKNLGEREMEQTIKKIHATSMGSPLMRTNKSSRDVIAFPVPECMCAHPSV